ncbi:MAG TPA: Ig-like domain-containing protein [Bryobacteraceae bacterium]|nr:Ig-like domain-containing protein [Bryobacteraceae bacterium]
MDYLDTNGYVRQVWYGSGGWSDQSLPSVAVSGNSLSSYVVGSSEEHIAYVDSSGYVHQVWCCGFEWSDQTLPSAVAASGSALTSYVVGSSEQHIAYFDTDGYVHQVWYGVSGWSDEGLPSAVASGNALTSYVAGSEQHITYLDTNGYPHQVWYGSSGWSDQTFPIAAAFDSGLTSFVDWSGRQHVIYFDSNRHIHEFVYSGGWSDQDITTAAQEPYIRASIDVPAADQTFWNSTQVTFSGWAVDDAYAISSVAIWIDGTYYGNASYGGSRSDVCAVYPGRPGCPNVGWSISLNTAAFPVGAHMLQITVTTIDGREASQTQSFSTQSPVTMAAIDSPQSTGVYSGAQTFQGWAVDQASPIASVAVLVDGATIGNASYGNPRPDVCSAVGNQPGCPNVGWTIPINTSNLTNGQHSFAVVVTTSGSPPRQTGGGPVFFYSDNPSPVTPNQALAPGSPKKEYVRANGSVVAVENHP